jgi:TonB family protein
VASVVAIAAGHVGAFVAADSATNFTLPIARSPVVMSVELVARPRRTNERNPDVSLPRVIHVLAARPLPTTQAGDVASQPLTDRMGIGTVPPHPSTTGTDARWYAAQAGLRAGEGATVVLRVEVLAFGELGRIEVDVSSGRRQVDDAAIAYARDWTWSGGLVNGQPHAVWVRVGVRLEGHDA